MTHGHEGNVRASVCVAQGRLFSRPTRSEGSAIELKQPGNHHRNAARAPQPAHPTTLTQQNSQARCVGRRRVGPPHAPKAWPRPKPPSCSSGLSGFDRSHGRDTRAFTSLLADLTRRASLWVWCGIVGSVNVIERPTTQSINQPQPLNPQPTTGTGGCVVARLECWILVPSIPSPSLVDPKQEQQQDPHPIPILIPSWRTAATTGASSRRW